MSIFIQGVLFFFNTEKKSSKKQQQEVANVCHLSSLKLDALSFRSKNLTSLHLASSHFLLGDCQSQWEKKNLTHNSSLDIRFKIFRKCKKSSTRSRMER